MKNIKIRLKINKPGNIVPVSKVVSVLDSFNDYLRCLSVDLGIGVDESWQMADATQKNQKDAIAFNVLSSGEYKQDEIDSFSKALSWPRAGVCGVEEYGISYKTIQNFIRMAKGFDEKDKVFIGTYGTEAQHHPSWMVVNKELVDFVGRTSFERIEFYGDIQGVIKAFSKEKNKNKCKIQELIFNSIVECDFGNDLYSDVVRLLERRDAIVNAYGLCVATRYDGKIIKMSIDRIIESPMFREGDIEKFKGCMPSLVDTYSANNLPQWLRNE